MKKRLTTKEVSTWSKESSRIDVNPWTLAFVFFADDSKKSILLKGGLNQIVRYMENNFFSPLMVKFQFYSQGEHRGYIRFYNLPPHLSGVCLERGKVNETNKCRQVSGWKLTMHSKHIEGFRKEQRFRKLPQAFPKALKAEL